MHRTRKQLVLDGFIAGLLGYAAVVLLFAFVNLASMRGIFATPEALGRAILGTTDRAAGPGGAMAPILAFNGLHLLVSLALGMLVAFLAEQAETDHGLAYGLVFTAIAVGGFVPIFFGAITVEALHALSWKSAVAGSVAGGLATLGYITWLHRDLVHQLFQEIEA